MTARHEKRLKKQIVHPFKQFFPPYVGRNTPTDMHHTAIMPPAKAPLTAPHANIGTVFAHSVKEIRNKKQLNKITHEKR